MMCSIYYGELSDERAANWKSENDNPYEVLKWKKEINMFAADFFSIADDYFTDKI